MRDGGIILEECGGGAASEIEDPVATTLGKDKPGVVPGHGGHILQQHRKSSWCQGDSAACVCDKSVRDHFGKNYMQEGRRGLVNTDALRLPAIAKYGNGA